MINDIKDITSFKWATVTGVNPLSIKLDGDTAPLALIPDSLVDPSTIVVGDRVRVELSLRKVVIHGLSKGGPFRGTTAERNARFGVPGSNPERVALANRQIVWFNTDLGWEECYYATTGKVGLLALGLVGDASSGWYPVGPGPLCAVKPSASKSVGAASYLGGWDGTKYQRGGDSWFTSTSNYLSVLVSGVYDFGFWTQQDTGSSTPDYKLRVLDSTGSLVTTLGGGAFPKSASLSTRVELSVAQSLLMSGYRLAPYLSSGSSTVHQGSEMLGQLWAFYKSPPLVSS